MRAVPELTLKIHYIPSIFHKHFRDFPQIFSHSAPIFPVLTFLEFQNEVTLVQMANTFLTWENTGSLYTEGQSTKHSNSVKYDCNITSNYILTAINMLD